MNTELLWVLACPMVVVAGLALLAIIEAVEKRNR